MMEKPEEELDRLLAQCEKDCTQMVFVAIAMFIALVVFSIVASTGGCNG